VDGLGELATFLEHVLAGLGALHARGILHLDIRPPNILYDRSRREWFLIDVDEGLGFSTVGESTSTKMRNRSRKQDLQKPRNHPTRGPPAKVWSPADDMNGLRDILRHHLLVKDVPSAVLVQLAAAVDGKTSASNAWDAACEVLQRVRLSTSSSSGGGIGGSSSSGDGGGGDDAAAAAEAASSAVREEKEDDGDE